MTNLELRIANLKKTLACAIALALVFSLVPPPSWSGPIAEDGGVPAADLGGASALPGALPQIEGVQALPGGFSQLSLPFPGQTSQEQAPSIQETAASAPKENAAVPSTAESLPPPAAAASGPSEISSDKTPPPAAEEGVKAFPADPSAEGTTALNPGPREEKILKRNFAELEQAFESESTQKPSAIPAAERAHIIGRVRRALHAQLDAMRHLEPADRPILSQVRDEGDDLLSHIARDMAAGKIDPRGSLRAAADAPQAEANERELRVGIYPVAADPFQWGHLLIGLRAIAAFGLDKVVYVLAGDDPRKPSMTPSDFRHPMGRAVLDAFAPFFEYSPIALGTNHDGETNLFRILALNAGRRVKAFYLVGGDHYRLTDKKGNPDTLPKLEKNAADPALGFDPAHHSVEAIFIARDGGEEHVPTKMQVHFLPPIPFEASSTLVRTGNHALMPYAASDFVQSHRPGLYNVPARGESAAAQTPPQTAPASTQSAPAPSSAKRSLNWRAAAPNALTLMNLCSGLLAFVLASQGLFVPAALAVGAAAVFDMFDGRVARMLKAQNPLGVDLDSLADVVSFGAAPAFLVFKAALLPSFGWLGFPIAAAFAAAGAWRLARFNVSAKAEKDAPHDNAPAAKKSDYFTGMPIPAGAGVVAVAALFLTHAPLALAALTLIAAAAMVSRLPYPAFKKGGAKALLVPAAAAAVITALGFVSGLQTLIPPAIVGLYLLSGPLIRALAPSK
ncbi:MAG: CDP-alcohol phosphatidyltransferase family protein [Elusimicrobia bacterium]|nr:CDP-alcohol phosphatidyltransferase family protein [Elusimicrobiota bacterium]